MKIVVLGAGRVGAAIVKDLAAHDGFEVLVADVDRAALEGLAGVPSVEVLATDLARPEGVRNALEGADLAVGAVPGPMGHATLRTVIESGVTIADISFFEENPFTLHDLARGHEVVAAVDCGLAPGISNLIVGRAAAEYDRVTSFTCRVGGLPAVRRLPWEYQSVFSPIDVIAEYTRPARLMEGGELVIREALSGLELIDVEGVGTLEAFNTDGLRTLLDTVDVPDMREKTMRFPGHADRVRILRDMGLFSEEPVAVGGHNVRPVDLAARLLSRAWAPRPGDTDISVLQAEVVAETGGRQVREVWNLLDRHDATTDTSSMARTTGYTCAAVVCALAEHLYDTPGITPPEVLGRDPACFSFVMDYLAKRGIELTHRVESVS